MAILGRCTLSGIVARIDPCQLAWQVNEIEPLGRAYAIAEDPCRLARQVNQIQRWQPSHSSSPAGQAGRGRKAARRRFPLASSLLHLPGELAGVVIYLCLVAIADAALAQEPAGRIEVPSMLLRLVEQVDVPAREPGVLATVHVAEGQMIEQDAAIAEIDDAESQITALRAKLESEIARANAENTVNVRFAKKSVDVAEAELRRSTESNQRYPKSISQSEMDRLRLVVEKGRLEVEQAEHESRIAGFTQKVKENEQQAAQQKLKQHKITAPLSGLVVQVYRHRGEWVKPGDLVVRILRLDRLRAEGFVKTEQWSADLQGRPVRLIVDLPKAPGTEFPGKVVFVDPEIDPVNAQVRVWAEVENRQLRLRPGMRARMLIEGKP